MKKFIFGLLIIVVTLILVRIYLGNHVAVDSNNPCLPINFCKQVKFEQQGFINGIYNANTEVPDSNSSYKSYPNGTYGITISFDKQTIWEPTNSPYFRSINFIINNLDDVEYLINGLKVSKDKFLSESFGAKITAKGVAQRVFYLDDTGTVYSYKLTSMNIIDSSNNCDGCKIFSNDFMSFSYPKDWKIISSANCYVQLAKYDTKEAISRYSMDLNIIDSDREQEDQTGELSKKIGHKIFSKFNDFVFGYYPSTDRGIRYFISYDDRLGVYGQVSMGYDGSPFPMEIESQMPNILFKTLNIKKSVCYN